MRAPQTGRKQKPPHPASAAHRCIQVEAVQSISIDAFRSTHSVSIVFFHDASCPATGSGSLPTSVSSGGVEAEGLVAAGFLGRQGGAKSGIDEAHLRHGHADRDAESCQEARNLAGMEAAFALAGRRLT